MERMGIEAFYRNPGLSDPHPGHKVWPYLLREVAVSRPNQIWAADITYIPLARGFACEASPITISGHGLHRAWKRRRCG